MPKTKGDTEASATIGVAGGALELASGAAVKIPKGALREDTDLKIAETDIEQLAPSPPATRTLERPVVLTPHGTRFDKPIDVSLPRSKASQDVADAKLRVLRLDDEQDRSWEPVDGIEVKADHVALKLEHFSVYVIAEQVSASGAVGDAGFDDSGSGGSPDAGTGMLDAGSGMVDAGVDATAPDAGACDMRLLQCDEYCVPGDSTSGVCSTVSVDVASHPYHCGGCGNACASNEACLNGVCTTAVLGQVTDSQTCVDCGTQSYYQGTVNHCVFPLSDTNNCGSCGMVCDAGSVCVDGSCQLAACCDGGTRCGEACLDVQSDPANCGGCDIACAATEACVQGKCTSACPSSLIRCGQQCVDPQTDDSACGGCPVGSALGGAGCSQGACSAGFCECGSPTTCIDVQNDSANCGFCGNVCTTDNTCQQGQCACSQGACSAGQCSCGGSCTDPMTDNNNCGRCGLTCASNEQCMTGECVVVSCDPGYTLCGSGNSTYCFNGSECPMGQDCTWDSLSCVAGSCQ